MWLIVFVLNDRFEWILMGILRSRWSFLQPAGAGVEHGWLRCWRAAGSLRLSPGSPTNWPAPPTTALMLGEEKKEVCLPSATSLIQSCWQNSQITNEIKILEIKYICFTCSKLFYNYEITLVLQVRGNQKNIWTIRSCLYNKSTNDMQQKASHPYL